MHEKALYHCVRDLNCHTDCKTLVAELSELERVHLDEPSTYVEAADVRCEIRSAIAAFTDRPLLSVVDRAGWLVKIKEKAWLLYLQAGYAKHIERPYGRQSTHSDVRVHSLLTEMILDGHVPTEYANRAEAILNDLNKYMRIEK